jgi:VHL beta domain
MRRAVLFAVLVGCGIDESGLLDGTEGGTDGAIIGDVTVQDGQTNDVTTDVVTGSDAGVDVVQQDVTVVDAPTEAAVDAGPILTITGGSYTLLDLDSGACSQNSNTATTLQLVNGRDASVDLVWVDFACAEQGYGTILPTAQANHGTYVTHVWRVRNDADKAFLAGFVLNSASTYTVTVH